MIVRIHNSLTRRCPHRQLSFVSQCGPLEPDEYLAAVTELDGRFKGVGRRCSDGHVSPVPERRAITAQWEHLNCFADSTHPARRGLGRRRKRLY